MHHVTPRLVAFLGFLLLLASFSFSAEAQGTKVCVGMVQHSTGKTTAFGRERLVKELTHKKGSQPVEAIPIDASGPEEALADAKQKDCGFVVTTDLTETHTESGYSPGVGVGNQSMPNFFVTVDYKLTKVGDGSSVSSGSIKARDSSGEEQAVAGAMKSIAKKIGPELESAAK